MRTMTAVAGLAGGLCWVGALWVGPLAVAVLGAGAGLVSRSAVWLRIIAAVCFLALARRPAGAPRPRGSHTA